MKWISKDLWISIFRNKISTIFTIIASLTILIITTLTLSYYIDVTSDRDNYTTLYPMKFYATDKEQSEQQINSFAGLIIDPSSLSTLQDILNEYNQLESVTFMRSRECAVLLPSYLFDSTRSENNIDSFLADPFYRPTLLAAGEYDLSQKLEKIDKTESHPLFNDPLLAVKAVKIDQSAAEFLRISVASGRTWNSQDFIQKDNRSPIPIIVGSSYKNIFSLNEILSIYDDLIFSTYQAQIIGFLPENQIIPHVFYDGSSIINDISDYSILLPISSVIASPTSTDMLNATLTYYGGSIVFVPENLTNYEFFEAQKEVKDIAVRNGYFSFLFGNPSFGTIYFQSESNETMNSFFVVMTITNLFFICIISLQFIGRIKKNNKNYITKLMLGSSPRTIIFSFLLEVLITFFIPSLISIIFFWKPISENLKFILVLLTAHISFMIVAILVVSFMLHKINISMTEKGGE